MFWGISIESGKKYSQFATSSFHVSMACLEPKSMGPFNKRVCLMVEEKGNEFLLCMLEYGKIMQVSLDLKFRKGDKVTFFLNGEGSVHLTGYILEENIQVHDPKLRKILARKDFEENDLGESLSENEERLDSSRLLDLDDSDDEDSEDYVPEEGNLKMSKEFKDKVKYDMKKKISASTSKVDEEDDEDESDEDDIEDEDLEDEDLEDEDLEDEEEEEEDDEEGDDVEEEEEEEEKDEASVEEIPTTNGKRKVQLVKGNEPKRAKTDVATPTKAKPKEEESLKKQNEVKSEDQEKDSSDSDVMESSIGRTPMPAKKTDLFKHIKPVQIVESNSTSSESSKKKKKRTKKKNDATDAQKKNTEVPEQIYSKKLEGGVEAEDIREGFGPLAKTPKVAHISYVGRLPNNEVFDSNTQSRKPFSFRLGRNEVIRGMEVGVEGMKVGGKRKLKIPSSMGYGKKGCEGTIPPNTTLYFTVELKAVT